MIESSTAAESHWSTLEVAHQLGMAVRSVQLMVDRGELEAWKTPGGHRRISRLSVELWMAQRRTGAAAAPIAVVTGRAESAPNASSPNTPRAQTPAQTLTPTPTLIQRAGLDATPAALVATRGNGPVLPAAVWSPALSALSDPSPTPLARSDRGCVLVIEDSKHYQNLVSLLLREHFPQLDVKFADDGIAGLAMVGQLRPRVLIVDILLPGIDGATLITSLRSHPQFATSGLLVITSLDDADLAHYRFALEGVTVVHKSRVIVELPQHLRRLLDEAPWSGDIPSRRHDDR